MERSKVLELEKISRIEEKNAVLESEKRVMKSKLDSLESSKSELQNVILILLFAINFRNLNYVKQS